MKISRSQRFLAYMLETEPGSETYIAYVDDLHAGTEHRFSVRTSMLANATALEFNAIVLAGRHDRGYHTRCAWH